MPRKEDAFASLLIESQKFLTEMQRDLHASEVEQRKRLLALSERPSANNVILEMRKAVERHYPMGYVVSPPPARPNTPRPPAPKPHVLTRGAALPVPAFLRDLPLPYQIVIAISWTVGAVLALAAVIS